MQACCKAQRDKTVVFQVSIFYRVVHRYIVPIAYLVFNFIIKVDFYTELSSVNKTNKEVKLHSPPISMMMTENIFSANVLAETLPKPTVVREVQV